jgi:hypothetical protein
MQKVTFLGKPSLSDYLESDAEARHYAADLIKL